MDLIEFKSKLRNDVLNTYRNSGFAVTMNAIDNLIKTSNAQAKAVDRPDLPIQIRGECCEMILEVMILEYARSHNLPWIVYKGLVLKRKDHKKGTTELDLTLFTPSRIILLESKYRKGKVTLIDECKIVPDYGNTTDVYKQNIMHLDNLRRYLQPAIKTLKLGKPFGLALFVESVSRVKDSREARYRDLVPVVSRENLNMFLDKLASDNYRAWDMLEIKKILDELDKDVDSNLIAHMKGVSKNR